MVPPEGGNKEVVNRPLKRRNRFIRIGGGTERWRSQWTD